MIRLQDKELMNSMSSMKERIINKNLWKCCSSFLCSLGWIIHSKSCLWCIYQVPKSPGMKLPFTRCFAKFGSILHCQDVSCLTGRAMIGLFSSGSKMLPTWSSSIFFWDAAHLARCITTRPTSLGTSQCTSSFLIFSHF